MRNKFNPAKIAGVGISGFIIIYLTLALIFGFCWQYAINTALELAGKTGSYMNFGTAYIIGLIPYVNGLGVAAALFAFAATFIVPLFM